MLTTLVVTLCLLGACKDVVVTDQITTMQCAIGAEQIIPQFMAVNGYTARGYKMTKWTCGKVKSVT